METGLVEKKIIIELSPEQAKQWVMMEFLNSIGAFDIKLGRLIIDFDNKGQIGNAQVIHNFKAPIF